jgi:hypothetical protein
MAPSVDTRVVGRHESHRPTQSHRWIDRSFDQDRCAARLYR